MSLQDHPSRLSSALVPFSVCQSKPARCRRQPAFEIIPLQRLMRSCGFSATPVRRRLSSFAPATVERKNRSCVTGLFLGGVPLSVPCSLDLVDFIARFCGKPISRQRSWDLSDPSQLCSCMTGERVGRPDRSNPACRFMNVRPGVFYAGDRSPNLFFCGEPIDQGTFISTSGICTDPARKRTR